MADKRSRGAKKAWTARRDKKVARAHEKKKGRKAALFEGAHPLSPSKEL